MVIRMLLFKTPSSACVPGNMDDMDRLMTRANAAENASSVRPMTNAADHGGMLCTE